MIFGKRANVHTKLYHVYKGSSCHNQYTSSVRQYTTPAAILQPYSMIFNLQKP